jgi:hypothetical protein
VRSKQNSFGLVEVPSDKFGGGRKRSGNVPPAQDVYEVRPRKERDGFDLVSDHLRRGPIWYAGPDAVRNAVAYAKYCSWSRSRRAIIRVLNESDAMSAWRNQRAILASKGGLRYKRD